MQANKSIVNKRDFNKAHLESTINELNAKINAFNEVASDDEIEFTKKAFPTLSNEDIKIRIEAVKRNDIENKRKLLNLLYRYL